MNKRRFYQKVAVVLIAALVLTGFSMGQTGIKAAKRLPALVNFRAKGSHTVSGKVTVDAVDVAQDIVSDLYKTRAKVYRANEFELLLWLYIEN